jgi:atlastin
MNGKARTGKSFILSTFLKYLKTDRNENWIDTRIPDNFKWKGGPERCTAGIQMWSEPFVIEVPSSGKKIALILMDTQGLFDDQTSATQNCKIFAFSALLSSLFIYNDKNMSQDVVQFLHTFLEYAKFTGNSYNNNTNQNQQRIVFQNLVLLIRDWGFDQENADYVSYKCGYYDDYEKPAGQVENLKTDQLQLHGVSSEARRARQGILDSFEKVALYAMASPGESSTFPVPNEESTSAWTAKFRNSVKDFVTHCLNPDRLERLVLHYLHLSWFLLYVK